MGQASSQPERRTPDTPRRSPSVLRRALHPRSLGRSPDGLQDVLLNDDHVHALPLTDTSGGSGAGSGSSNNSSNNNNNGGSVRKSIISRRRLCEIFRSSHNRANNAHRRPDPEPEMATFGPALLNRTRSRFQEMLRRDSLSAPRPSFPQHRSSYVRSASNNNDADDADDDDMDADELFAPPRLDSIDVSPFDHESITHHSDSDPIPRTGSSSRRSLSMMLNPLRHDRSPRSLASTLRRRRSPHPSLSSVGSRGIEDQATILSRLLSVAAAATAATLMGLDHDEISEARNLAGAGLGDWGGGAEDGSFDGFLRALENGRIASALRESGSGAEGGESGQSAPLNIFRMFRFGATNAAAPEPPSAQVVPRQTDTESSNEGRMVPIIIVGIRSISPGAGAGSSADELPPFIDALGHFPPPVPPHALGAHAHDTIDSILRPPQNSTSFRHRRRASMGAFGMGRNRLNDRMDEQRDQRSPERRRERPWSVASSSSTFDPRPPPATPASPSPELSRIPSRNSTPDTSRPSSRPTSMLESTLRDLAAAEPRRNRGLHRSVTNPPPLSAHTEETNSIHSTHSATNLLGDPDQFRMHRRNEASPHVHYPRFSSGHPRRNGVVEPDHLPSLSRSSTGNASDSSTNNDGRASAADSRSWIIYVLGGSYPENHPILTTPSLFTENPTYEDMMLLSALLGPAKAPVATEQDVESAGGVYEIRVDPTLRDPGKTVQLVAAAVEGDDRVALEPGQRCLVCLCDFEQKEVARKLAKCTHLFHKECIDQWLTTGRNSCPLCREQGVDEKEQDPAAPATASREAVRNNAEMNAHEPSVAGGA